MGVSLQRHALGVTWVEEEGMARAAHALVGSGRVWLVDPYDNAEALGAASELGATAGVIQLLDRHNRDCATIARRLDVPLLRLPDQAAGTPFTTISVLSTRVWREVALWWPDERALVVAEAVGTAPLFALGRRAGVHPMLRLFPPRRALLAHQPERLFVGHGAAVESDAAAVLREAIDAARTDMPKLLATVPKVLREAFG